MADNKETYPTMPVKNWFALRKQFHTTLPGKVTLSYLASTLGMTEKSARNILPNLRSANLIDSDGKPTELAVRWRDDKLYAQVCEEIRKKMYPQELLDIAPDANADRDVVQSWFANKTGIGESVARKLSTFYLMLCRADPLEGSDTPTTISKSRRNGKSTVTKLSKTQAVQEERADIDGLESVSIGKQRPSIHFDIQIHISPETSADQIDQIFASMAKHLKDFA